MAQKSETKEALAEATSSDLSAGGDSAFHGEGVLEIDDVDDEYAYEETVVWADSSPGVDRVTHDTPADAEPADAAGTFHDEGVLPDDEVDESPIYEETVVWADNSTFAERNMSAAQQAEANRGGRSSSDAGSSNVSQPSVAGGAAAARSARADDGPTTSSDAQRAPSSDLVGEGGDAPETGYRLADDVQMPSPGEIIDDRYQIEGRRGPRPTTS